ncbi:hypothetical protein V8D89_011044 [Ganoderma adspersum]
MSRILDHFAIAHAHAVIGASHDGATAPTFVLTKKAAWDGRIAVARAEGAFKLGNVTVSWSF